jgi:hypothetical protein
MPSDHFAVSIVEGVVHVEGEIDSHVAHSTRPFKPCPGR